MFWNRFVRLMVSAVTMALAIALWVGSANAQCRIDWDKDGEIAEADYLEGDPIGGFYAEWYIYMYYPGYYPVLFPAGNTGALDYNGDSIVDENDLMGALDPVYATEGFYVEWYIYMYYPAYYPVFFPEFVTDCENVGVIPSPEELPDAFYHDVSREWYTQVSRDGALIAGFATDTGLGFVVSTADYTTSPGNRSNYEYLMGEDVRWINDISDDNNIIAATVYMTIDGESWNGGAYYNRSAGSWTYLPAPEAGIDFSACRFYPSAAGMSADGTLIVGDTATLAEPCKLTGFVYNTVTDSWTMLPSLNPNRPTVKVTGCNKDASVIFGWEQRDAVIIDGEIIHYGGRVPMLWNRQTDGTYVAQWLSEDPTGEVTATNHSGDHIVGKMNNGVEAPMGMIWGPDGSVMETMPSLNAHMPDPFAVSDNGDVVVGSHSPGMGHVDPFIRLKGYNGGQISLIEPYFTSHGITNLMNWSGGFVPESLSSDGKVIVGIAGGGPSPRFGFVAVVDHGLL